MAEPTQRASSTCRERARGGFPPFNPQTFASQLFWLAITFVLLYVLMARLALPRVGAIIDDRQKRIAGDLAEAERLKEQSDAAVAAYEKALADARARAQAIANETRDKQQARSRRRPQDAGSRAQRQAGGGRKDPSPPPSRRPWPMSAPSRKTPPAPSSNG